MTIAVTVPVASLSSTANATSYNWTSFFPAPNALLVAFVAADGTVAPTPTMTGGGLTWVLKASVAFNGGVDTLYVFYAKTGAAPAFNTPVFDCTGDAATGVVMNMLQLAGSDLGPADPFVQSATNSGTGTAPGVTFGAALKTANVYLEGFGLNASAATATTPTAWTLGSRDFHSVPAAGAMTAYRVNGETTTGPFNFTSTSGNWGAVGLEVRPAVSRLYHDMVGAGG